MSSQPHALTERDGLAPLPTFHLFPKLVDGIRIMIWKAAYEPRRIIMRGSWPRTRTDPSLGKWLFVSYESCQIFNESYHRCFQLMGRYPVLICPDIDTVDVGELSNLEALALAHPTCMGRLRWIDVPSDNDTNPARANLNLQNISRDATITVRQDPVSLVTDQSVACVGSTLQFLKQSLLASHGGIQYTGPRLTAVIGEGPRGIRLHEGFGYHDTIYFVASSGLQHASYGALRCNYAAPESSIMEEDVKWTVKNANWDSTAPVPSVTLTSSGPIPTDSIFNDLTASRRLRTEYQLRLRRFRETRREVLEEAEAGAADLRMLLFYHGEIARLLRGTPLPFTELQQFNAAAAAYYRNFIESPLAGFALTVDGDLLRTYEAHKIRARQAVALRNTPRCRCLSA